MQLPGESTDPSIGLRISASLIDISLYRANLFQVLCSDRSAIFTRITSSVQSKHGVDNLNLLMHCGDILRNPGPEWKYPCGVCQKPVKNNQKGLQCDSCDLWYHTNCCRVNDIVYNALANSSCSWICCGCGLPNFSSSLFDIFDIFMQNYYHSLPSSPTSSSMSPKCDNGADLRPNDVIGPPRHSSSPSRSATKRKNLRVLTVNCQSLRCHSKHLDIAMLVQKYNPDVINATETHLNSDFTNSELGLRGYDVIRCDRVGGMGPGGGVLVATREDLLVSPTSSLHTDGLEAVFGKINISGSKTLHVGCVYRQPNNNPEPINTLTESLISTTPGGSILNMLITGDFNFPDIDWDIEDGEHKYFVKSSPQYGYEANEAMLDLINQPPLASLQINRQEEIMSWILFYQLFLTL